mgnify:CR=1 FL=1
MEKAPSKAEFHYDCRRLLKNIHYFDSLRSDRTISSQGLEARAPFADKAFVRTFQSVNEYGQKTMLRDAFVGLLPNDVLYRPKEAFSDGVSSPSRSWHAIIKEKLPDEKEYYRSIFEQFYGQRQVIPFQWMPRWCDTNDPSARTIS